MAGVRQGMVSFPGLLSVTGVSATISHGISPGTVVIRCNPQSNFPPAFGNVVITDGTGVVPIPKCKVANLQINHNASGKEWIISLVDKRWKWRELGAISGSYNQLDPHGKLIPWMIRSPYELAVLCLQAMGETNFSVDMPAGINSAAGAALSEFAGVGQNFPASGTNPPIDWNAEVPAIALQRLCDMFGRRIVYNPLIDKTYIVRPGQGGSLPGGSIAATGPVASMPNIPDGVAVYGSPTRYQARFELEAVGEEWNGEYKPLNALSYAPFAAGQVHIVTWTLDFPPLGEVPNRSIYTVTIKVVVPQPPDKPDYFFSVQLNPTATETENAILNRFKDKLLLDPVIKNKINVTVDSNVMTLTAVVQGDTFTVEYAGFLNATSTNAKSEVVVVKQGKKGVVSWEYTMPPLFSNVRATDRLTYADAVRLAQKSVYKMYRYTGRDVSKKGLTVIPGFGRIRRKQQVYLLPTKVDQIVPEKNDPKIQDNLGRPITINFYNGYSRDKPAILLGSVSKRLQLPVYDLRTGADSINSPANSQVFCDISIDPIYQVVIASNYLFTEQGPKIVPAELILETGCHVRDLVTNQFVCYIARKAMGGGGLYKFDNHPDVQLNYSAEYTNKNAVKRSFLLEQDAIVRANYYLQGMAAQYFVAGGQTQEYNGIVAIHLDGAICQASWEIGESGCMTKASRNTEHDLWIAPYPARRRAELLDPIAGGNKQLISNSDMRNIKPS